MAIQFNKLPRPNINKNVALLIGALVLSGISVVLVLKYLETQKKQYQADLSSAMSKGMVQVVVPARDVPAGTIVDGSNMSMRLYPQDLVYEGAVTAAKWREFQGRLLVQPVKTGKPLLASDFKAAAALTFAASLPPNTRAVTVSVDTINSINGFIRPGDKVDILLSVRDGLGGSDGTQVLPVLRHTTVLATGRTIGDDTAAPGRANEPPRDRNEYNTITVAVTPQEATSLVLAQQVGTLRVMLESAKTEGDQGVERLTQRQLLARLTGQSEVAANVPAPSALVDAVKARVPTAKPVARAVSAPAAAPESRGVQFIIGGGNGVERSTLPDGRSSPRPPAPPAAAPAPQRVPVRIPLTSSSEAAAALGAAAAAAGVSRQP